MTLTTTPFPAVQQPLDVISIDFMMFKLLSHSGGYFISMSHPLFLRAASLFLLVILFQVIVAKVNLNKAMKRRLQHALTGHVLVQISYFLPLNICIALLVLGATAMYISQQYFGTWFRKVFGDLLRADERMMGKLPGAFYFLVGTALTALLCDDLKVARYAVECLSLADPMASYIGSTIRSPKLCKGSTLSGCIACFVTALGVGYIMLGPTVSNETLLLGSLACTIAEAVPYGNDNLNIPLITGIFVDKFQK